MNIYIFSKTNWEEMPRLRHQVARMLAKRGHKIIFFQKPTFLFGLKPPVKIEKNISIVRVPELVHHQLKINRFIKKVSDIYFLNRLKVIKNLEKPDCIINFNYDFDFLLKTFNTKTIFIINDDFTDMSRFWMRSQSQKMEISTIKNSNQVFTVSKKIFFKYKKNFPSKFSLFFPWAQRNYKAPLYNLKRNTILFYGYIDDRIDWSLLQDIIRNTNFSYRFVGPILDKSVKEKIDYLCINKNFKYSNSSKLSHDVLKGVFCSLIPYSENIKGVDAVTISNRTIQLLSYGIPIITKQMKFTLIKKNVIFSYNSKNQLLINLNEIKLNFINFQIHIKKFVEENNERFRYTELMKKIKNC